eukprot:1161964-Pelagomonas_calceolata.AAC.8
MEKLAFPIPRSIQSEVRSDHCRKRQAEHLAALVHFPGDQDPRAATSTAAAAAAATAAAGFLLLYLDL